MLIVNKPGRPSITLRLFTGTLDKDFEIGLRDSAAPNFRAFALASGEITRDSATAAANPLDYRWVLNLRTLEDHANAEPDEGAKPLVRIKTGVLYTPNLTKTELTPKFVRPSPPAPSPITHELFSFAADLAVATDATKDHPLRLSWSDLGEPQLLDVPRPNDPAGTNYTISIVNDPPFSNPPDHDEMARYYRVLTVSGGQIPFAKRFQLRFAGDSRTDEIPCQPVTLEP